ncbi:major facilitator superfamily domain-containing protein [Pseudomassariella vexata]|uniref:Major facilitator superfamily domain-containing protein n=1 Tax=Pseudomassariella vexata TaxID=1141098 RepID=A0A1Y2D7N5_9PEZI|nr:major facilitator superfamily domain-containing protein [Pseudomassariella vexata]ORY55288.1 major facilitator superfamily domain-containing protein [Pseudomassariella vexata]
MAPQYGTRATSGFGRSTSLEEVNLGAPSRRSWIQLTWLETRLLLGLLFSCLDASIVSTSLVSISLDLQDFLNAPWVVLSYLLAYFGFAVGFAKMSDIYGRRTLIIISWILFTGFSLGCGLAQNMLQLTIFRAFQGIGGSGLYSLAQIGLFEIGPAHNPSLLGALVGMTLAVSFVLGPILGGTISHMASWRWIFFINIPCGVAALLSLIFAWPRSTGSSLNAWDSFRSIDFLGNIMIIAASTLLVFSLQSAGSFNFSWNSPVIIITLTVASLSWIVFLTWEFFLGLNRHTRIKPVLPLRLFTRRPYLATLICTLFSGFSYLAIIIILPERFQIVNLENSLMSGVHLLPALGACAFGSFLAGALSAKRNNTSITLIVASCLQLIGVGLMSTLSDITTEIQAQYGYQAIFGLGVGLAFGAATILTAVQSAQEDLAVAQGSIAQARVFGGAVGIAVCSIIFNAQVQNQLAGHMKPEDLTALHHSPTITSYLPPQTQLLVRRVYASAFTFDIQILICVSAVALLASLFTFELHPPPMPSRRREEKKEDLVGTPREVQSETELEDMASVHRTV